MTKQILLIDADIVCYRCGFAVEKKYFVVENTKGDKYTATSYKDAQEYVRSKGGTWSIEHKVQLEPVAHALQNVNTVLNAINNEFPGSESRVFLSGKNNYRHSLATIRPYKGNRSPFAKPSYYADIREHLIKAHNAVVIDGMEADDEIGIQAHELGQAGHTPVIVTTDKDLNMIPGLHYNWVKKEEFNVTDEEGFRNFYRQLLTGDAVDNVPGIEGIGPVRAGKILAKCRGPSQMLFETREAWGDAYPKGVPTHDGKVVSAGDAILEVGRLLWIKRSREEPLWNFHLIQE